MPQSLSLPLPSITTSSPPLLPPPLSFFKLTHPHLSTSSKWTFLVIGGTAVIATIVIGGGTLTREQHRRGYSCSPSSLREQEASSSSSPRKSSSSSSSSSESEGGMFGVACYLVEKISGFIPWRAAASALDTIGKRVEGVELDERGGGGGGGGGSRSENGDGRGGGSEGLSPEEMERMRELQEELEVLKGEVTRLKQELDEEKKEKKVAVAEAGIVQQQQQDGEKQEEGVVEGEKVVSEGEVVVSSPQRDHPYAVAWDSVSEDEVVLLLNSLNTEISELAQAVTRAFASVSRPPPRLPSEELPDEAKEAIAGVAEILGPRMVELLQLPTTSRQRVLSEDESVKMALQASMATYTHWIISSWYFENPEDEHLLSEIYARVRETEEQMVSGRWRALTRRHLQRMLATDPDLTIYMVDAFVNIILTAEWHNDGAALQEYLVQTFGEKIGSVLDKAKRLNKVIGEEIMRCDLEALYIAPDVAFNPGTMEVERQGEDAAVTGKRPERVLCTTDLGLVRAEKKVDKVGEWDEAVLLKPNVILQSSVVSGV